MPSYLLLRIKFLSALSYSHGVCSALSLAAFLFTERLSLAFLSVVFLGCAIATGRIHGRVQDQALELVNEAKQNASRVDSL